MGFFDRKEEVIDIELTQYGKHLLSLGKFKPDQYAFFDDDILYDIKYSPSGSDTPFDSKNKNDVEESQNISESRIKETPRPRVQYNFSDRAKKTGISENDYQSDCGPRISPVDYAFEVLQKIHLDASTTGPGQTGQYSATGKLLSYLNAGDEVIEVDPEQITNITTLTDLLNSPSLLPWVEALNEFLVLSKQTNNYGLYSAATSLADCLYQRILSDIKYYPYTLPLGHSSLSKRYAPAWSIKFLNGELTNDKFHNAKTSYSGSNFSTMQIPQLYTDITHKTYVSKLDVNDSYVNDYAVDNVLFSGGELESATFKDNTLIQVKTDYLFLEIDELNTDFIRDNFEIEVFAVIEQVEKTKAGALILSGAVPSGAGSTVASGKTLTFEDAEGNIYLGTTDSTVARNNGDATTIGTSDVNSGPDLLSAIRTSLKAACPATTVCGPCNDNASIKVSSCYYNPSGDGDERIHLEQDIPGEKGNTRIEGSLIDEGLISIGGPTFSSPIPTSEANDGFAEYLQKGQQTKYFVGGKTNVNRDMHQRYFFNPEIDEDIKMHHVEYYFDLLVDGGSTGIPSKYYCKSKKVDEKQSILADQQIPFNCEDFVAPKAENIYKIKTIDEDFEVEC